MNELGLSAFVMGARIRFAPDLLLENMKTLIKAAGTNFLIIDGHHCTEKTAVIETVNSMMLQTVEGVIYLFPCWTQTPAAFTRLRAKGAFLVSADYDGTSVGGLKIFSEKGGICRLSNPWRKKTSGHREWKTRLRERTKQCLFIYYPKRKHLYDSRSLTVRSVILL